MIKAYNEGKDLYAVIASIAFDKPYEECLESFGPEGKERRGDAKIVVLGVCYGKGIASLAEDIGKSVEEAQTVYDKIMQCFPGLLRLMEESQQCAREKGYVETIWGRRRHLPDMQLPKYSITCKDSIYFDPFFDSEELGVISKLEARKQYWISQLDGCKYSGQKIKVRENAAKEGFTIKDNGRFIAQATRQCVNCVDDQTEILTKQGWKTVYDLKEDDTVLTVNPDTKLLEWNNIISVNRYTGKFKSLRFKSNSINCVSTLSHKWLVEHNNKFSLVSSDYIRNKCGKNWTEYPIVRITDNHFSEANYPDWFLQLCGLYLTDGSKGLTSKEVRIYQSLQSNPEKCAAIDKIFNTSGITYTKNITKRTRYVTWRFAYDTGYAIRKLFPNRVLTPEFICSLSQRQAKLVVESMVLGDGTTDKKYNCQTIITSTKEKTDMFQMLCVIAGISTNFTEVDNVGKQTYCKQTNSVITCKNIYYIVRLLKRTRIHIYKRHIREESLDFVWCPTVKNGTWVARRNGDIFVTGNSRVQGSAADQTKIACNLIGRDELLKQNDFRILLLVHDEIIGECPAVNAKVCASRLSDLMIQAAKDICVPSKCDVEVSDCWYGESLNVDELCS